MTKMKLVPAELTSDVETAIKQCCYIDYCREYRTRDYENLYDDIVSAAPNGGRVSREAVEKAAIAISGAPFPTSNSIRKAVAAFRAADLEVEE